MHPLLKKLQRRFSRSPNILQTRSAAELLPFRSLRAHWILGRSLCMYSCLNFAQVPRSRREAALRYRMPALSPFERTGHCAVWSGSEAMVWYWDADVVDSQARQELLPPAGADPAHCPVLPETLFRPPQQDGLHVHACSEGYEVQQLARKHPARRLLDRRAAFAAALGGLCGQPGPGRRRGCAQGACA